MRRLALALGLVLVLAAIAPGLVRGAPEEASELRGGLRRGVVVTELRAVLPRGVSERAVFAEVRVGGVVGLESKDG